jgi:hypothetical protein
MLYGFMEGHMTFTQLVEGYQCVNTEGSLINSYRSLFEFARENADRVVLHAACLPRYFAKVVAEHGVTT